MAQVIVAAAILFGMVALPMSLYSAWLGRSAKPEKRRKW